MSTFGLDRLLRSRGGNVAMMYALIAPVLVFGAGAAIDYGRTAQINTKLNAAADAAALAALTPAMLQQSATVAQAAASPCSSGLADSVSGLTKNATKVTVTVTTGANPLIRNVEVSYSTSVNTIFAQVLGMAQLSVQGSSQASAQSPPNIDFYVLLDNSPSMALPATTAGITQMENLTRANRITGGLRLRLPSGEHEQWRHRWQSLRRRHGADPELEHATASPASSAIYCNVSKHGAQIDNYQLARNNGITLRLDELNTGVSTLLQTASTTAQSSQFSTPPKYRFSIYSMDTLWSIGLNQLMPLTTNYIANWTTDSANFGVMEMYTNNKDCANAACSSSTTAPGGDVATSYDDSLGKLSQTSYIPNPGNGTNQAGDTPQEVLFIVTDGVEDEESGGSRLQQAINDLGNAPGGNSNSTNWCTTIKNRGIKIAILYTDYLPVPANSWYDDMDRSRSSPTSARPCRPARRPASSMTRRSARTSDRRSPRCSTR